MTTEVAWGEGQASGVGRQRPPRWSLEVNQGSVTDRVAPLPQAVLRPKQQCGQGDRDLPSPRDLVAPAEADVGASKPPSPAPGRRGARGRSCTRGADLASMPSLTHSPPLHPTGTSRPSGQGPDPVTTSSERVQTGTLNVPRWGTASPSVEEARLAASPRPCPAGAAGRGHR